MNSPPASNPNYQQPPANNPNYQQPQQPPANNPNYQQPQQPQQQGNPYQPAPPGGWPMGPNQPGKNPNYQPPQGNPNYAQPPNQPIPNYQQPPPMPAPQQLPPNAPAYPALPQNLSPPPQYPGFIRFDEGVIGIEFVLRQGQFVLTVVRQNGAAFHKGVRVGQKIESVFDGYGRPIQGSGAPQLAAQISNAPRPIHMKFANANVVIVQRVYAQRPSMFIGGGTGTTLRLQSVS